MLGLHSDTPCSLSDYTMTFSCNYLGELPIEDLLKLYNLERNPDIEEKESLNDNQQDEEESSDDDSSGEDEEQTVDEPSLELLISGKSLEEVST